MTSMQETEKKKRYLGRMECSDDVDKEVASRLSRKERMRKTVVHSVVETNTQIDN
jgi:hypothetical protein